MGMESVFFNKYDVLYVTEQLVDEYLGEMAQIYCYNDTENVGSIIFFRKKENVYQTGINNGFFYLYYHISRFNDVIQLLQNEDILYLAADPDKHYGYIGSGRDYTIGEKESSS